MNIVLDACAVIAFFRNEEGGDIVEQFLIDPDCNSYIHAINLCEVYYDFVRSNNQVYAEQIISELKLAGVIIRKTILYISCWFVGFRSSTQPTFRQNHSVENRVVNLY